MSTNATSHLTIRGASVLTAACLLFLASCGRETLAPATPENSVSALASGLANSSDKNDGKKSDDKKGDDKKNDDSDAGLVITTAPSGAKAGVAFTVQPVLELRNRGGKLVMGNKSVTVSIVGSTVVLGGTTSVTLVKGVARFTDLTIPTAGTYTLLFTSDSYTPVHVTIIVAPRTADLTVTITGASGTVSSDVGGINCPGTCTATYGANTLVTLTVTSSPAVSTLQSWGGACSGNSTCVVTMDAAKSVTATFVPAIAGSPVVKLTFANLNDAASGYVTADFSTDGNNADVCTWSGTGAGTGICTWTFPNTGVFLPLTATPDSGFSFNGWTGVTCANLTNSELQCVVPVNGTANVTANFKKP